MTKRISIVSVIILVMTLFLIVVHSCDISPLGGFSDPYITNPAGTYANQWVIYDDYKNWEGGFGGGIGTGLFTFVTNEFDFLPGLTYENYKSDAQSGQNYVRLYWDDDGRDFGAADGVGLQFVVSTKDSYLLHKEKLDLNGANYQTLTFFARLSPGVDASVLTNYDVKAGGNNGGNQITLDASLTSSWNQFTINLTASDRTLVEVLFVLVFQRVATAMSISVDVDNISYNK